MHDGTLIYGNPLNTSDKLLPATHMTGLKTVSAASAARFFSGTGASGTLLESDHTASAAGATTDFAVPTALSTSLLTRTRAIRTGDSTRFVASRTILALTQNIRVRIPEILADSIIGAPGEKKK